jgi:hypothetical protein
MVASKGVATLALLCLLCAACGWVRDSAPVAVPAGMVEAAQRNISARLSPGSGACGDWQDYLPDPTRPEDMPLRLLRVNFHIMNSRDSSHNFRPDSARAFFTQLLARANAELDTNLLNWRSPPGTKVLPKRYRYVLWPQPVPGDDGFYFHYDDEHYFLVYKGKNQNNYDQRVLEKYAVGRDSIINIFIQVHPDDSLKSPSYKASNQGIALGTCLKMANIYEQGANVYGISGLLNHEVGHLLSLSHAWGEDRCPDTDKHPNRCWEWTETGPCLHQATNNVMDYNAYQIALTPCQIGRVHRVLSDEKSALRRCVVPTWLRRNPAHDVVIRDSVVWNGARDLEGNLTVAAGGALRIACRLSLPEGARLTVEPGGRLWLDGARLHNAGKRPWKGLHLPKKRGKRGMVRSLSPTVWENCQEYPMSNKE